MRVAFVLDDTTKYGDANLALCNNLAKYISSQGGEACIIGHCVNASDLLEEKVDGIAYYRFYYPINRINKEIFVSYEKHRSFVRLAMDLLRHPATACVVALRVLFGFFPIEKNYIHLIETMHNQKPFDAVIACGGAFQPIHALAKCRVPCKKIGYMLDPHWKHVNAKWYYKREELFAWKNLDRMVVPKLLSSEYDDAAVVPYLHKMVAAEFPGIIRPERAETGYKLEANKVNLVFAGNFYANIRNPRYLFDLIDRMKDNICLHVFGSFYDCDEDVAAYMERLQELGKVKIHGTIPTDQLRTVLQQADILVNIGNSIDNMLPSKIFEYFSTGKPVIHIQKIRNCPCKPYLEKYENVLILEEWEAVSVNAQKLEEFCNKEQEIIPFEQVQCRFKECTVLFAVEQMLREEQI